MVLAAALMVVVLAFVAFSVDVGYICVAKAQLQNAADAAAMAAASNMHGGDIDVSKTRDLAIEYAGLNFAAGDSVEVRNEDVELGTWDKDSAAFIVLTGEDQEKANAVRVTCRRTVARGNPLQLFFAPMIGNEYAEIVTTATAFGSGSRCGLIVGLSKVEMKDRSYTDSYNSDEGPYSGGGGGDDDDDDDSGGGPAGNDGHVCSNGDIKMSNSSAIYGDAHPGPGKEVDSSSSNGVMGETVELSSKLAYPPVDPSDAETMNDNDSIPNSDDGKKPLNKDNEFTLSSGDGIDFPPGTYYFDKMTLSGGASVRISGETTIYIEGDCDLRDGRIANFTYRPENLLLFPMGNYCKLPEKSSFMGVVYGPETKVERKSNYDFFGAIIGREVILDRDGGVHVDQALDFDFLNQGQSRSVLVQ